MNRTIVDGRTREGGSEMAIEESSAYLQKVYSAKDTETLKNLPSDKPGSRKSL